jgi:hypothetical protein
MQKLTQYKIKVIPYWRKILFVCIILLAVMVDMKAYVGMRLTLIEFLVAHFNALQTIDYVYLLLIMIISMDIYNGSQNSYEDMLVLKLGGRKRWYVNVAIYTLVVSFIIVITYMSIAVVLGSLNGFLGLSLKTYFLELNHMWTFEIVCYLILLTWLRIVFINLLIIGINLCCINNPMGFLAAFILSMADMFGYELFDVMEPKGIFPLEHTRLLYTEAVAPPVETIRIPIGYSILYWIIGIGIVLAVSYWVVLKKDFLKKSVKY